MNRFFGLSRGFGNAVLAFLCVATMSANAAFVNDNVPQKRTEPAPKVETSNYQNPVSHASASRGTEARLVFSVAKDSSGSPVSMLSAGLDDFWASVKDRSAFEVSDKLRELAVSIVEKRNSGNTGSI